MQRRPASGAGRAPLADALVVAALVLLAFALRSVFVGEVLGGDGTLVLTDPDALYHARLALYALAGFPRALGFDPYLNHPDGAPVPWPPLWDAALAAAAAAQGGSPAALDRVLAWSAPLCGALGVLPVVAIGRLLSGRGVAAGAGALYAALPVAVHFSRVGSPDHHAAVSLLGASFLALSLAALRPGSSRRALAALGAGLLAARALVALTWNGSLLYLGVGELALLLGWTLAGRRELLSLQAVGALGAAGVLALWLRHARPGLGGPFSTHALSWFHVAFLAGVGLSCAALAALERRRAARSWAARAAHALALGSLAAAILLAFPEPREALAPTAAFLAKEDGWVADQNLETRALFGPAIEGAQVPRPPPTWYYGWLAYAIPVAMALALSRVRRREGREASACFAAWTLAFGALALYEIRFGPDFAPVAAVAFALGFAELRRLLSQRLPGGARASSALVSLLAAAALWPAASDLYAPQLARSLATLREDPRTATRSSWSAYAALLEFGRSVRAATPETAGFLDASLRPEYGILAEPTLGHPLRWASRRPLPADNFGPLLDAARFARVLDFYRTRSEAEALEIAEALGTPYVVTAIHAASRRHPAMIQRRLHADEGSARDDAAHLERFRLVTEGPLRGRPLLPSAAPRTVPPYKLFEVVRGALLEVRAAPGARVDAELPLETPIGRRFVFRAVGRADADGLARLRVPYPSEPGGPTRALGPWRVRTPDAGARVAVGEREVLEGGVVRVEPDRELAPGASHPHSP